MKATVLRGAIDEIRFSNARWSLGPEQRSTVRFAPAEVPALRTCAGRGCGGRTAWARRSCTTLALELEADGAPRTGRSVRFGIQEMGSELTTGATGSSR